MNPKQTIETELTKKLGLQNPILLAGMSGVSHADLAAAVSNAGGLGVIGGLTLTPKILRMEIADLKSQLRHPDLPFGIDLAIPQIGGSARKTNHDYTHGHLPELIDIIIGQKATLFVCAVGVPPRWAVDKLHNAGIWIMNMIGAPKHVDKALEAGVDMICAQGTEGGGHTGEIGTLTLIPQCVQKVKGFKSEMDGSPILVVGAGGITNGRTMAASFALGASAVWIGTRFVASIESHASDRHKETIVSAESLDTLRTLVFSGRPLRTFRSAYVDSWEVDRKDQIDSLCAQGIIPVEHDAKSNQKDIKFSLPEIFPMLMGQGVGDISKISSANDIVNEMMDECIQTLNAMPKLICKM